MDAWHVVASQWWQVLEKCHNFSMNNCSQYWYKISNFKCCSLWLSYFALYVCSCRSIITQNNLTDSVNHPSLGMFVIRMNVEQHMNQRLQSFMLVTLCKDVSIHAVMLYLHEPAVSQCLNSPRTVICWWYTHRLMEYDTNVTISAWTIALSICIRSQIPSAAHSDLAILPCTCVAVVPLLPKATS